MSTTRLHLLVGCVSMIAACGSEPTNPNTTGSGGAGGESSSSSSSSSSASSSSSSNSSSSGGPGSAKLALTITLHLENATFDAAYFQALDAFAANVEKHGARLTFEPRTAVVTAASSAQINFDWRKLEARGHAIGSHAAIGGTMNQTLAQFEMQAKMRYDQLLPVVNKLEHISGNCGNVDWVTGVTNAGFSATTAATVLCLYAMAPQDRPPEYQNLACSSPTDPVCHKPYPEALDQRIHPWRAKNGATWLTHDPTGPLVIFPGSGTLPCLEEEATSMGGGLPMCTFTQEDVTRAINELDAAIALIDPSKINTFYWVWGSFSLSSAEAPILEAFLTAVDQRVTQGKVEWKNVTEMHADFVAWEAANP
ncbi:MAG TPA: hypothetical protein PK156_17440 [Polyangium sp.]|nr:hypothetical protein [Polyangium sp.]